MDLPDRVSEYSGGNYVLDALPKAEWASIYPLLRVCLDVDPSVLQKRNIAIDVISFPIDAIYSIIVELADDVALEVATVGRTGVLGVEALVDAEVASRTVLCQLGGRVANMERIDFEEALKSSRALYRASCRALRQQLFVSQQTIACNAAHNDAQRCARWLLMTAEQTGREKFGIRREYLGIMLGLRIAQVDAPIGTLCDIGAIEYAAGIANIVSRATLREAACECFAAQTDTAFIASSWLSAEQTRLQ